MSFILEALRKSEQQRRQGEVPRLGSEPPPPPPRRSSRLLVILVAALLLNGALLGWWLLSPADQDSPGAPPQQRPATGVEANRTDESAAAPQTTAAGAEAAETRGGEPAAEDTAARIPSEEAPASAGRVVSRPAAGAPEAEEKTTAPAEPVAPSPAVSPGRKAVEPEAVLPLSRLPANIRAGIPEIELQLHFFTSRPERRMVRLNGSNLREGETGPDGLLVEEINSRGVVLRHRGQRFFYRAERE